jgi:predicted MFS family arabinose efflux permease
MGNRVGQRVVAGAALSAGVFLVLFGSIRSYAAGLILMFLFGAAYLLVISGTNSGIQLTVEDRVRGRVISIWMLAFGVAYPVGSLLAGVAASAWGPQATVVAGALVCSAWGLGMLRWLPGPSPQPVLEPGS